MKAVAKIAKLAEYRVTLNEFICADGENASSEAMAVETLTDITVEQGCESVSNCQCS